MMTIDTNIHKTFLINILKDIFTNDRTAPYLGFKGGTAAMLFYDLDRFSVDLDFDLLNAYKEMEIFSTIDSILKNYGTIKKQNKRYSLFFALSYTDKVVNAQKIKVEVNKRDFGSRYTIHNYLGIPVRVMIQEDMAAHKLVAMYERLGTTNRDIFDVWFFLHNKWPINRTIIEQRTHMPYRDFLNICIAQLDAMGNQSILAGIGELLTPQQKRWAKSHLLSETLFLLKLALETIL